MDKELEYRLVRIEDKLSTQLDNKCDRDLMSGNVGSELNLRELWNIIWDERIKIIAITAAFALASVVYAFSKPNIYQSTMILVPSQNEGKSGLGALASQYGSLAAVAGIDFPPNDTGKIEQAIELLKSWPFLKGVIDKHGIAAEVYAIVAWDRNTDELIFDTDLYDPVTKSWLDKDGVKGGAEPSSWKAYRAFQRLINISYDNKKGLLFLSVENVSPHLAQKWVTMLCAELNQHFQKQDILSARLNVDYLRQKISETEVTDMQSVFYSMIESQMKTLMLAEVSDEYMFKIVVRPMLPEQKVSPRRGLIVVLWTFLGGVFSIVVVIVYRMCSTKNGN